MKISIKMHLVSLRPAFDSQLERLARARDKSHLGFGPCGSSVTITLAIRSADTKKVIDRA